MKTKIIYALLIIALGTMYYFANSYTNGIELEAEAINTQNRNLSLAVAELKAEYIADVEVYPDYRGRTTVLPEYLKWNTIIAQLDRTESKLGLEITKSYEGDLLLDEESKYTELPAEVEVIGVSMNFTTTEYTFNEYLKSIQNYENLVIIDSVYVFYIEGSNEIDVDLYLLYFTYNENREE